MKISLASCLKLAVAVALLSVASARAEDPAAAKTPLAEQLIGLLNVDKNYDATYQRMLKMQDSMAESQDLTPEQRQQRDQATKAALKVVKEFASWEAIKPTFVQIYADTFTAEELQGMIDFYKSPVGQKFLEKQPIVQEAVMQKMGALMASLQPKIMAAMKDAQSAPAESPAPSPAK
jgi:hypothetical protein